MPTRRASSDVSHQEDAGCRLDLVRPDDRQIVRDAYREFVTLDVDIAILSVCLSACHTPVLYRNGLTYQFLQRMVPTSFWFSQY